jgi:uncharacterized membrane protein
MVKTIGNPLSWSAHVVGATGSYLASVTESLGAADSATMPRIRRLYYSDLRDALRSGIEDFTHFRTDVIVLCLLYPAIGLCLAALAINGQMWHLLFPVLSGFALIGPVAAVGLYEMSRRREKGMESNWMAAFQVLKSPAFGAIFVLGLFLVAFFFVWVMAANVVYDLTLGPDAPVSASAFVQEVLYTQAGWAMIALGTGVGFVFALVVLAVSVVSFPLLLDRNVGLPVAVITSIRVARRSPGVIAVWGLIVALSLAVGSIPLLLGLVIVFPVLGHATWHLYRKAVAQ